VGSGLFIEKRCCPFFIATKVIGKCPTWESGPAALVAVDEVKRWFGTIYANEDVPQEKIPVKKASVMHTPHKISKSPVDGKQLILIQLFLDSKIEKTVTVCNTLCDKELPLQEAKATILCGDKGTHSGEASFSQLEEIIKFPNSWSASPGSHCTKGILESPPEGNWRGTFDIDRARIQKGKAAETRVCDLQSPIDVINRGKIFGEFRIDVYSFSH